LPARDQQVTGYPRFDSPGVITGYYIASLIPSVEMLGLSKATQIIQSTGGADGAISTTAMASAIVAAIASLVF